jgi:hypothetical protein
MDRVGDIWREVFSRLPIALISSTMEASFKNRSNDEAANLWKMCTIELPEDRIRRLGFLATPDPRVAKDFIERIDRHALDNALLKWARAAKEKAVTAGVVSYFVHELGYAVPSDLKIEAIEQIKAQASRTADPEEKESLTVELESLRKKTRSG